MKLIELYITNLTEKHNYEAMFSKIINDKGETASKKVASSIKWAKRVLRKNDKIVWFLHWTRLALIHVYYSEEIFNKALNQTASKQQIDLEKIDLKSDLDLAMLIERMEHFYGMDIDEINNYDLTGLTPTTVIDIFIEIEQDWLIDNEDHAGQWMDMSDDDAEKIVTFNNGSAWFDLKRHTCDIEAKTMGHCGNRAGGIESETILSYRIPKRMGDKTLWKSHLTFILDGDGFLGEMKGRANEKPAQRYHQQIIKLLRDEKVQGIKGGGYEPENNFEMDDLDEETRTKLIEMKPSLGGLAYMYKMEGVTPRLLKLIESRAESVELSGIKFNETYNGFVVEQFENVNELVEQHGNDKAQYVLGLLDGGDDHYDYGTPDDSVKKDLFASYTQKNTEIVHEISKKLRDVYNDDIAQVFPDDDFDDKSEDDIWEVLSESNNDLYDQIGWAINDGERVGAESEMHNAFINAVKGSNNLEYGSITFENGDDNIWDKKAYFVFSILEMIEALDDEALLSEISYHGWDMGEKLVNLEEPHYGWSGYDENTALERLGDYISDWLG